MSLHRVCCCSQSCPFYYRVKMCQSASCDLPVYVFVCADSQCANFGRSIEVGDVLSGVGYIPPGASGYNPCSKLVDGSRWIPNPGDGSPPPDGYNYLPDGARIATGTSFTCYASCADSHCNKPGCYWQGTPCPCEESEKFVTKKVPVFATDNFTFQSVLAAGGCPSGSQLDDNNRSICLYASSAGGPLPSKPSGAATISATGDGCCRCGSPNARVIVDGSCIATIGACQNTGWVPDPILAHTSEPCGCCNTFESVMTWTVRSRYYDNPYSPAGCPGGLCGDETLTNTVTFDNYVQDFVQITWNTSTSSYDTYHNHFDQNTGKPCTNFSALWFNPCSGRYVRKVDGVFAGSQGVDWGFFGYRSSDPQDDCATYTTDGGGCRIYTWSGCQSASYHGEIWSKQPSDPAAWKSIERDGTFTKNPSPGCCEAGCGTPLPKLIGLRADMRVIGAEDFLEEGTFEPVP